MAEQQRAGRNLILATELSLPKQKNGRTAERLN